MILERCFNLGRLQRAYDLLDDAVRQRIIPGGVALVGVDDGWLPAYAVGLAVDTPEHRNEAHEDTVYDLASLTKVVAALPALLLLVQDGVADLQSSLVEVFPEWKDDPEKSELTLLQLLTHTSGFPAHHPFYAHGWSADEIMRQVISTPLEAPPGTRYTYSDLGYILLGEWVRRVTGETLDVLLERELYVPLGMSDTRYRPPNEWRERTAAGEYREHLGRHQWGEVNDDNAYALGGVSGHAGLYSTASDLARYLDACWLPWRLSPDGRLSPAVVRAALSDHTSGLGARRGLGWVLKGDRWDNSGLLGSEQGFGHTGYTGTSLWIDPVLKLKIILLTNRVHSSLEPGIVGLRRRFHSAVTAACVGEEESE